MDLFPAADAEAIEKSLELHYAFSIEDLTMGNALRKSPIAWIALGRGLARASAALFAHDEIPSRIDRGLY